MLYAQAIQAYRDNSPGLKQFPARLHLLLLDSRHVGVARHLRTLYADPVNQGQPWGLILDSEGRIAGVFSRSEEEPLAQTAQNLGSVVLTPARRYSDWKFVAMVKS